MLKLAQEVIFPLVRHGKRHSPWSRHALAWALAGVSVKAGREAAPQGVALREAPASAMIGGSIGMRWWGSERTMLVLSVAP
jgi:hypothetical protein